jgi:NADH:ubiquinone oxidoreductase subunit C
MSETIIDKLRQEIGMENVYKSSEPRPNRIFVWIDRVKQREAIRFLKEQGFTHLSAITGLDAEDGIELLYHLSNGGTELTLRITLPLNENIVPTISDIILGAVLYEREVYDLLGVKFDGHPNLTRLILPDEAPEDFHPLRKNRRL